MPPLKHLLSTTAETKESKNYITEISTNTFNVNKNNSNNNNLNTKSAQTGLYNNNWGSIISRWQQQN